MNASTIDLSELTLDELAQAHDRVVAEVARRRAWSARVLDIAAKEAQEPWLGPARPDGVRISRNGQVRRVAPGERT